ncbi:MAG: hypothetical protein DRR08_25640 [Candidatus Parabeggiatoa sp. nov. 2]|nr:MAG: hypothetical protein B6247_03660 [Beggiatoa sp. 4572_84]RKZ54944.1 MAG: hypothetical protein DRR08_25640 [Gammaproteobacteria bacterium]
MIKEEETIRGTDETFLQLMKLSGNSLLKMLGFSAEQAEKYTFQAVDSKEKELKPDIEGFPILASDEGRIFIEFQGYWDPFVCHRLMAEVFLGCASEKYSGEVVACIVYTDKTYQDAALPLNEFTDMTNCHLGGCIREIVLTDYSDKELEAIDPKLVVLAPFTLSAKTSKTTLLAKGQEWSHLVREVFPDPLQKEALDLLGLFLLHRFRQFNYEEVVAMLNFDLMDTVAGQQIYDMGREKGVDEGYLGASQEMLIGILTERFGVVPSEIMAHIRAIKQWEVLKNLPIQALRCPYVTSFKKKLS